MGEYLTLPTLKPLRDGAKWQLTENFLYHSDLYSIDLIIPKNFVTDLASIPLPVWRLMPPATGKYRIPAIVHDYLYNTEFMPREAIDNIFLEAMKDSNVSYWKRYTIYWSVRAFGGFTYNKHSLKSINGYRRLCKDYPEAVELPSYIFVPPTI